MADITILKRIYLLKAAAATTNGTPAQQVAWLMTQLTAGDGSGVGDSLTAGGWEITSQAAAGRSSAMKMHATDEERSVALLQAIDSFGLDPDVNLTGILTPNFLGFMNK